jgi:ribosomal subunit interface protein
MSQSPTVVIHFKEVEHDEPLKDSIEKQCQLLTDNFHEITRIEVSLEESAAGFTAHGHVTGKGIDVATQSEATKLTPAVDVVFDKIERQLRKIHDKRIFSQRRDAQRDPPKRQENQ